MGLAVVLRSSHLADRNGDGSVATDWRFSRSVDLTPGSDQIAASHQFAQWAV